MTVLCRIACVIVVVASTLLVMTASAYDAVITRVIDGDTIEVEREYGHVVKIRLRYVDTPEVHDNAHGPASPLGLMVADHVQQWCDKRPKVSIEDTSLDRYGRTLAVVYFYSGMLIVPASLNERIILDGFSPYWTKYGKAKDLFLHRRLSEAQDSAMAVRAGLWSLEPAYMRPLMRSMNNSW